ncbi:MAG: helix-turn-helix transcriptional regulator [Maritimibacter sp.]|uniref:helix-turn-helix domain-containing protein n=1 Tax=Maritimibacter sp. TaxID=2003363 RepID=UPI001DD3A077|nr:helix-turn-helix transcriptional regulator [Maritimibacter sp.]MBL6426792.1 helix-turn-helix transcriptional regulator [Maritimibacter sp.]
MEIGERLMRLRQSSNQSLQQVADAVGVSKAHVWELEKGRSRNPSFELVRKLASHYGVSIDVLTGTAPEPAPEDIKVGRMHRDLESLSAGPGDRRRTDRVDEGQVLEGSEPWRSTGSTSRKSTRLSDWRHVCTRSWAR